MKRRYRHRRKPKTQAQTWKETQAQTQTEDTDTNQLADTPTCTQARFTNHFTERQIFSRKDIRVSLTKLSSTFIYFSGDGKRNKRTRKPDHPRKRLKAM